MRTKTIAQDGDKATRLLQFRVSVAVLERFRKAAAREALTRQEAGRSALEAYCKRVERKAER